MAAAISTAGQIGDFEILQVLPDNSYPTGGYDLSGFLGPNQIAFVVGIDPSANEAVWVVNPRTRKLLAFGTAGSASGLTQIAGTTDLSGQRVTLLTA